MKNLIWLKNGSSVIFCDRYEQLSNITIAYYSRMIIAVIDNSQIKEIEIRGIK